MRGLPSPIRRTHRAGSLLFGVLCLTSQAFGAIEPAAAPVGTDKPGVVAAAARRDAPAAASPAVASTAPRGKGHADDRLDSCREIVQRASLQPLTPEDAATLRKSCN